MKSSGKDRDDRRGETLGAPGPVGPFGPIEHRPEVVRQHENDCRIQLLEGQVRGLLRTVTAMESRLLRLEATTTAAPREPTQDRADEARRANKARRKRGQRQRRAERREREWLASQCAGRLEQELLGSQAAPHT